MAHKDDLNGLLADLKRQRDDLDERIKAVEENRGTAEILDRLQKWRERSEQLPKVDPNDDTLPLKR